MTMKTMKMKNWAVRIVAWTMLVGAGVTAQAQTCNIDGAYVTSGSVPFGPTSTNVRMSAVRSNISYESTVYISFRDDAGRLHSASGQRSYRFQANGARVVWTFSPAVPAHRVGLAIDDLGGLTGAVYDGSYNAQMRFSVTGGATRSDFQMLAIGSEPLAVYDSSTGLLGKDLSGSNKMLPHSGVLRGRGAALVSTMTLEAINFFNPDWVHVAPFSIPSCITLRTSSEHGIGTFDFNISGSAQKFSDTVAGAETNVSLTTTSISPSDYTTASTLIPVDVLTNSAAQASQDVVITGAALPTYWKHVNAYCQDSNYAKTGNPSTNLATVSGRTLTIPASAIRIESNIICSYVQQWQAANVEVVKTNASDGSADIDSDSLAPGVETAYSIVATNHGPLAADGAVVRDTVDTGLTCSAAQCTGTTGGATCPATTLATLTGSGVTVPTFPANSSVTFQVTCATPAATP